MARLDKIATTLLATEKPVILGGDYNVIPQAIDCYDENAWIGDALYHPQSRSYFHQLLHKGYTDAFRSIHPNGAHYSFWDYQAGAWQKNNGIRIDHLLLSPEAADKLVNSGIDQMPSGLEKASDHTPIWCDIRDYKKGGKSLPFSSDMINEAYRSANTCVSDFAPGCVVAPVSAEPTVCAYFQIVPEL